MLGCCSRAASRASLEEALAQIVAVDPQDLERDLAFGDRIERQVEHAHATVRNALTELVAADCRGWRGQCADYTHRSPRRPRAWPSRHRRSGDSPVFRRATVLIVTAARRRSAGCTGPLGAPAVAGASRRRSRPAGPIRRPTGCPRGVGPGRGRRRRRGAAAAAGDPAAAGRGAAQGGDAGRSRARRGKGPFLWRVEGAHPDLPLRHHPRARRPRPGPPAAVLKAFRQADRGLHRDPDGRAAPRWAVMGKVMLPDGTQLSDVIGEPLYNRMTARRREDARRRARRPGRRSSARCSSG